MATLVLTIKIVKDIISYEKKLRAIEKDKLNLELDFLKSQVNPHFLFNTLNSIYADIFDTNEKAADLVLRLSELMRYNLYETNHSNIALEKELAYIQNYLDLERNRLADLPVEITYQQQAHLDQYQISPLLLIVFVENAFKHGIKGNLASGYVRVDAIMHQDELLFRVANSVSNRVGILEGGKRSGGLGLPNVHRRLETLYPNKYTLETTSSQEDYMVTLRLQLEKIGDGY